MDFRPVISPDLKKMDANLFRAGPVGLDGIIAARPRATRSLRLAERAGTTAVRGI
jgi:propionate CoA-transferase